MSCCTSKPCTNASASGSGCQCNSRTCISKSSSCSVARVQQKAPCWRAKALMPNGEFKEISSKDYEGKYLVFFSYPLDFTFVCPTEIIAFSERASEFAAMNTEVVAWSVDSEFSHLAWTQMDRKKGGLGPMNIPIVSDLTREISRKYGVLLETEGVALRGLFIIDPQGIVRQITINDLPVGRNVDEILRLVEAFQFTDKHGEVCPANWKKGEKSMKADPKGSLDYFSSAN